MTNVMLERLSADVKTAMKSRDADRLQVLRMLVSGLQEAQHQAGRDTLDDAEELVVLQRAVKTRKETIDQAVEAGRMEIAERERAEIAIIQDYLPEMLSGDALDAKVREVAASIEFGGASDKGKFMKAWMSQYKGMAEGRDVQAALSKLCD